MSYDVSCTLLLVHQLRQRGESRRLRLRYHRLVSLRQVSMLVLPLLPRISNLRPIPIQVGKEREKVRNRVMLTSVAITSKDGVAVNGGCQRMDKQLPKPRAIMSRATRARSNKQRNMLTPRLTMLRRIPRRARVGNHLKDRGIRTSQRHMDKARLRQSLSP